MIGTIQEIAFAFKYSSKRILAFPGSVQEGTDGLAGLQGKRQLVELHETQCVKSWPVVELIYVRRISNRPSVPL